MTDRQPVTDLYHGIAVQDDYRWLESGDNDAVKAWTAAQNAHTRSVIDGLRDRAAVGARVAAVLKAPQTLHRMNTLSSRKPRPPLSCKAT